MVGFRSKLPSAGRADTDIHVLFLSLPARLSCSCKFSITTCAAARQSTAELERSQTRTVGKAPARGQGTIWAAGYMG